MSPTSDSTQFSGPNFSPFSTCNSSVMSSKNPSPQSSMERPSKGRRSLKVLGLPPRERAASIDAKKHPREGELASPLGSNSERRRRLNMSVSESSLASPTFIQGKEFPGSSPTFNQPGELSSTSPTFVQGRRLPESPLASPTLSHEFALSRHPYIDHTPQHLTPKPSVMTNMTMESLLASVEKKLTDLDHSFFLGAEFSSPETSPQLSRRRSAPNISVEKSAPGSADICASPGAGKLTSIAEKKSSELQRRSRRMSTLIKSLRAEERPKSLQAKKTSEPQTLEQSLEPQMDIRHRCQSAKNNSDGKTSKVQSHD